MRRSALLVVLAAAGCAHDYEDIALGSGGDGGFEDVPSGGAPSSSGAAGVGATGGGAAGGANSASSSGSPASSSSGSAGCMNGDVCAADAGGGTYVRVATGAATCPTGWGTAVQMAAPLDPGCESCTCGSAQGGGCPSSSTLEGYGSSGCGSYLGTKTVQHGVCANVQDTFAGLVVPAAAASSGSCAPSAVSPLPLAVTTVCGIDAQPIDGCPGEGSCVPPGDASFVDVCVAMPAQTPCPPGWGSGVALAPILSDTRTCGCSCGNASAATCAGASVQVFSSEGCSGASIATLAANGQCGSFASNNGSLLYDAGTWTSGSCPPQPSSTGSIAFGSDIVLCCLGG